MVSADDRITQKYLRRYPDSKRARSWAGVMVHIETENGVWREGGAGYTWAHHPDAWRLPFDLAQEQVSHCGPEKKAVFIRVRDAEPVTDPVDTLMAHINATFPLAVAAGLHVGIKITALAKEPS